MAEYDELEWLRDQLQIDGEEWNEVMQSSVQKCYNCSNLAPTGRITMIQTYAQQLKAMAEAERVDLLDACLHAGVSRWTYQRSIAGDQPLRQSTAEQIAKAIQELGIH